eukprot:299113-Pelagomonas_calceolata.AAC.2
MFPCACPPQLPRAKAAGHQVAPDLLTASTDEEVDDFLWSVLRARRDWMEVWTERLREWFSGKVLRPLVGVVQVRCCGCGCGCGCGYYLGGVVNEAGVRVSVWGVGNLHALPDGCVCGSLDPLKMSMNLMPQNGTVDEAC